MTRKILIIAALLTVAGCVQPNITLVSPNEPITVEFYEVTPPGEWNRLNYSYYENWTVDGYPLQALRFHAVPDGQSLVPNRSTWGKLIPPKDKTPVFRKTMTPNEVQEFVVETLSNRGGVNVKASRLKPAKFGKLPGFRFSFSMTDDDGLEFDGMALGTIKNDELHIIVYSGTRMHYFPTYKRQVERIFKSIKT